MPARVRRSVLAGLLLSPPVGMVAIVAATVLGGSAVGGPSPRAPGAVAEAVASGPERAETLTIGWVGDITPGSRYGTLPGDGGALFDGVRGLLRRDDLLLGNLEGTLGTGGASKCAGDDGGACFSFQAPPEAAGGLARAGFDVLSVANNHAHDFGAEGARQTLAALAAHDIAATGTPGGYVVNRRRGIRVAVLGFAPYPWANSLLDLPAAAALVRRADREADVVVVTAHLGAEGSGAAVTPDGPETYLGEARGDARAFARAVVDAGADLVLGAGPHVLRGMETYKGRLIAHSLGNFAGVHNFSTAGDLALSGLLSVRIDRTGRLRGAWLHALRLDASGRPAPDPARAAVTFVARRSGEDFPQSGVQVRADGRIRP